MEPKKSPQSDLRKKSTLFLSIGLMISLLLTVTAFEWKSFGEIALIDPGALKSSFDELLDVPITIQKPPMPPVVPPEVIEVPDDTKVEVVDSITFDVETLSDTKIEELVFNNEPGDENVDKVVDFAEVQPTPEGGLKAFYTFINKNIKYPQQAIRIGTQGKVYVSFVVDKTGNLTDIKVLKGIVTGCDEEAIRVVGLAPKWIPGKQGHRPVKVRMRLPITFRLN